MTYPQGFAPGATIPMVEIVYTPLNEGKPEIYPIAKPKIRWEDLILLYGNRIDRSQSAPGDDQTATVYAVPEGKVFLLTSAAISGANNSTVRRTAQLWIRYLGDSSTSTRLLLSVNAMPQGQNANSISPCVPIIVNYGESLSIFNEDPLFTTLGQVSGYEIDTNLFQTLY